MALRPLLSTISACDTATAGLMTWPATTWPAGGEPMERGRAGPRTGPRPGHTSPGTRPGHTSRARLCGAGRRELSSCSSDRAGLVFRSVVEGRCPKPQKAKLRIRGNDYKGLFWRGRRRDQNLSPPQWWFICWSPPLLLLFSLCYIRNNLCSYRRLFSRLYLCTGCLNFF